MIKPSTVTKLASAVALALAGHAHAIGPFTPLTASATLAETNENTHPFKLPPGWLQTKIVDVAKLNDPAHFNGTYPTTFRAFDMLDIGGSNHQLLYIPHEVQTGAGLTRYDRDTDTSAILLQGNDTGTFDLNPIDGWDKLNDDFGAFDPAVLTPWGILLVAEEWSGGGRIFELLNPETATSPADAQWRWLSSIPSVSHEGLKFDAAGNLYFIDEWNSGSIYKFVPKVAEDLSVGQTFVLKVDAYAGQADQNWDHASNTANRTGAATWLPITDANGVKLTTQNPFFYQTADTSANQGSRGGLKAADELDATPYGRPEDLEIGHLANGHEVVYFTATSEQAVYSIELDANGDGNGSDAIVRLFVKAGVSVNENGVPVPAGNQSTYGLGSPDNLDIDPDGDVFINEDQNPGDIWKATDSDKDGVAEKIELFASLGPFGSEPTGVIADPRGGFLVNIQHPSSDNDALWLIRPANDADLNHDGLVDQLDAALFRASFGTTNPHADFNGDGVVDQLDAGILRSLFGTSGH